MDIDWSVSSALSADSTEGLIMARIFQSFLSQVRPVIGAVFLLPIIPLAAQSTENLSVTVVIARKETVTETIPVVGSLVAREEVQVHPLIQGRVIEQVLAEVGQTVKKGDPLALLDVTEPRMLLEKNTVSVKRARAAVAVEESRRAVAEVSLNETLKIVERSRALQPKGAVSLQLLDEHENAYSRAVAEFSLAQQSLLLTQAEADLVDRERREIELTIERSTVRAPADGLVLRRKARIGNMTSAAADPLFVLAKDGEIELVAQVTETSFVRLEEGMAADVKAAGHDGMMQGTIRLNAAELDTATRSGEVRIELGDIKGLKPGMFARATVRASARHNIVLPGSAVKIASGANRVFVVNNGVVNVRPVTIGTRQDGLVEIVEGISDGEMVVLKSGVFLKADERVRPIIAPSVSQTAEGQIEHEKTAEGQAVDGLASSFPIGMMEAVQ